MHTVWALRTLRELSCVSTVPSSGHSKQHQGLSVFGLSIAQLKGFSPPLLAVRLHKSASLREIKRWLLSKCTMSDGTPYFVFGRAGPICLPSSLSARQDCSAHHYFLTFPPAEAGPIVWPSYRWACCQHCVSQLEHLSVSVGNMGTSIGCKGLFQLFR